jgi:hypothetical protein
MRVRKWVIANGVMVIIRHVVKNTVLLLEHRKYVLTLGITIIVIGMVLNAKIALLL